MANLMLHQGSGFVGREELRNVFTPPPTHSWQPISHEHLLNTVEQQLGSLNYHVTAESHGLSKNGSRYFGLLEVEIDSRERDFTTVVGLRNSNDKTIPAGLCLGSHVLVCDNLCFSGQVALSRKHTRFIMRELPRLVCNAILALEGLRERDDGRIAAYKQRRINHKTAHDLAVQAIDQRIIPVTKLPMLLSDWRQPAHDAFLEDGQSIWRFQNAITEVWKDSNLNTIPRRSEKLHLLLDRACGFQLAA